VRRTASGAAGNGLGTTILRCTRNGAAGNHLASTIKHLRGAAGIGLGATILKKKKFYIKKKQADQHHVRRPSLPAETKPIRASGKPRSSAAKSTT
jgi:hypothetical protein